MKKIIQVFIPKHKKPDLQLSKPASADENQ
jgi:hypothetical protein